MSVCPVSMTHSSTRATETLVEAPETARLQAINRGDIDALALLLGDDLVHIHATGLQEGKVEGLSGIAALPRFTKRQSSSVRVLGDVCVRTGDMTNTLRRSGASTKETVSMKVTQVACRSVDGWKFVSFHAVCLPPIETIRAGGEEKA